MNDVGSSYRIISVLGSQSSGKSTLLNCLFGTEFGVMRENSRSQTTKGIWLSNTSHSDKMLVMDVEGTDGREHGENQDFERKSALFSLALSEVLIINMWEHSIGLYNGANMALLKTVFEVNLELFGHQELSKTLLLFVIRDFLGVTPLESLGETLKKDLHNIWSKLNKPAGLENSVLEDFFDLQFAALPHKILKPAEFNEGIEGLQEIFFSSTSPKYLFPAEKYQKSVPIDGLSIYANGIWDQILHNKDLDLPTQQQLLSQFRCDEIGKEIFTAFKQDISPFQKYQDGIGFEDGILNVFLDLKERFIFQFQEKCFRYHPEIITEKKQDLVLQIDEVMCRILFGIGRFFLKEEISKFETEYFQIRKDKKKSFKDAILEAESNVRNGLKKSVSQISSDEISGLSFQFLWNEFDILLGQEKKTFIDENSRKIIDSHRSRCIKSTNEIISGCIENIFRSSQDITINPWTELFESVSNAIAEEKKGLSESLSNDLCSSSSCSTICNDFLVERWKYATHEIVVFFDLSHIVHELFVIFEKEFKYDKKSEMPRLWSPSDNIDQVYTEIVDRIDGIIGKFKDYTPQSPMQVIDKQALDEIQDLTSLMTESKLKNIQTRFRKQCEAVFLETKRSLLMTKTKIPAWILVLLVYLGWREILTVIRNPFYLLFLIVLASTLFVVYSLNLQKPVEFFLSQTIRTTLKTLMSCLNMESQPVTKNGSADNASQ